MFCFDNKQRVQKQPKILQNTFFNMSSTFASTEVALCSRYFDKCWRQLKINCCSPPRLLLYQVTFEFAGR